MLHPLRTSATVVRGNPVRGTHLGQVTEGSTVPCDAVIIQGYALLNESMLTGLRLQRHPPAFFGMSLSSLCPPRLLPCCAADL